LFPLLALVSMTVALLSLEIRALLGKVLLFLYPMVIVLLMEVGDLFGDGFLLRLEVLPLDAKFVSLGMLHVSHLHVLGVLSVSWQVCMLLDSPTTCMRYARNMGSMVSGVMRWVGSVVLRRMVGHLRSWRWLMANTASCCCIASSMGVVCWHDSL
jgi:hypothetical protein